MLSFETIYAKYYPRVYATCLRITKRPELAEEFTQDTFVKVFRHLQKFRGDSKVTTWIHRIAVNEVLMERRRKYFTAETSLVLSEEEENGLEANESSGRDLTLDGTIDRIQIDKALTRLARNAPKQAQIFALTHIYGYREKETARIVDRSCGSVKSQLSKARKNLAKQLER